MKQICNKLPVKYLEWLVSSRIEFLKSMGNGHPAKYFSAHLPVMATWHEGEPYPVNMTVKGVGLLPEQLNLQHYADFFESIIAQAHAMPWKESIHKRMEAVRKLYSDVDNFDPAILGGLEIFGGKAYENLRNNPHASLLYVGMKHNPNGIEYTSFQVNVRVEILEKNNFYYKFLLASRKLFEFDKFHLYQTDYPFGYLFHVVEVIDKTPWSKSMTERKTIL